MEEYTKSKARGNPLIRLEELEFDPMLTTVRHYNFLIGKLEEIKNKKIPAALHAALISNLTQVTTTLLRYGYFTPGQLRDDSSGAAPEPIRVILTSQKPTEEDDA